MKVRDWQAKLLKPTQEGHELLSPFMAVLQLPALSGLATQMSYAHCSLVCQFLRKCFSTTCPPPITLSISGVALSKSGSFPSFSLPLMALPGNSSPHLRPEVMEQGCHPVARCGNLKVSTYAYLMKVGGDQEVFSSDTKRVCVCV